MKSSSDIDNFFKQKLADPVDVTGNWENDWSALEKMMDKPEKRRGIVFWLPLLGAVAALFVLVLGWWLFKPVTEDVHKPGKQITKMQKPQQQQTGGAVNKNTITVPEFIAVPQQPNKTLQQIPESRIVIAPSPNTPSDGIANVAVASNNGQNNAEKIGSIERDNTGYTPLITQNADTSKTLLANNNAEHLPEQSNTDDGSKGMVAKQKNAANSGNSFLGRPQFALTIMGAPDVNGVSSFSQGKTGTNIGLVFSATFKKLTVSTGVAYSYKPYSIDFDNYSRSNYYFKTDPTSVLADCRMLDIPLNIDYQLFNKNKNKISVGTGLSSYIMLRENYTYEYADPYARGPRSYGIASPGKYFFGVLNLQATYKRQVNSKVGVSLQPYLKLPLGDVGASKVRLQSAGVALGVSWNINTLKKP